MPFLSSQGQLLPGSVTGLLHNLKFQKQFVGTHLTKLFPSLFPNYIHVELIRYGCRNVTVVGSVMASVGFLAAAFSNNIYLLYLFFGVIAGCGLSLCYVASIIIVAYYFDRRRSFATGISVCGSGVGESLTFCA